MWTTSWSTLAETRDVSLSFSGVGGGQNFDRLPRRGGQNMKKIIGVQKQNTYTIFLIQGGKCPLPSPPNNVPGRNTRAQVTDGGMLSQSVSTE